MTKTMLRAAILAATVLSVGGAADAQDAGVLILGDVLHEHVGEVVVANLEDVRGGLHALGVAFAE